ncbi:chorismate mutase [Pseudovibrio sp. SPO723]|uniref:chorismate mutase n=1 Tax=Nesiotobacter zosterae TaxID=392721 RepID=UPI0029C2415A|nr:chorismate mutase [Pseudovibrio sp. SPO723]MDX5594963.1 chorismate mutase [Pseudovibrio sp. SPO723]
MKKIEGLKEVRARVDAVDAQLHELLIERAALVGQQRALEEAAGLSQPLHHPAREAEVLRARVEAHAGPLSLLTVEHLWREIIAGSASALGGVTLHMDGASNAAALMESARFYFGFDVPLSEEIDPPAVLAAVHENAGDLGIVGLEERAEQPWWRGLGIRSDGSSGPMVVARLPFLVMDERAADLPALVIAGAYDTEAVTDVRVYDARWNGTPPVSLMSQGIEVLSFYRTYEGVDALLAVSGDLSSADLQEAFSASGALPDKLRLVGGYAAPIDIDGEFDGDPEADERSDRDSEED